MPTKQEKNSLMVEIESDHPTHPVLPDHIKETFLHALQLPADRFPADKVVSLTLRFTYALSEATLEVSRR